ncbi:DUF6445 family protein [Sphingomonas japonica]|uniref:Uncharacterized protein n=1 Tax=Sphingomonas japonica TaxID=511662 RepID=A0ABX0U4E4_9SPHN|nr:DUF6445 family protein [Sphingomonas japonica]NIJ23628.1 hypothetical protein [Sphingomonas japonica]
MKPELRRFGHGEHPLVLVDDMTGDVGAIIDIADAMQPYPPAQKTLYPGLRRVIGKEDAAASGYVDRLLQALAPYIGGAFATDAFDLIEASFSMVTADPATLAPAQRAPHFDSTDLRTIAILHYLSVAPGTGTSFYRHRASGIEQLTDANLAPYLARARAEAEATAPGYIAGSNAAYEAIAAVEAVPDRLVMYRGALLHSGVIPADMELSADPRRGRLTANLFIQVR